MFVRGDVRLKLIAGVASDLAKLNPKDPGYQAKAIEVAYAAIDEFRRSVPLSPLDREKLAAQVLQGAVGCLQGMNNEGRVSAQAAATLLDQTKEILRREKLVLERFGIIPPNAERLPPPPGLAASLSAFAGLAGTMGTPIAHDSYVRFEAAHTVRGARANDVGDYGKRQREFMMPFEVVSELAASPRDNLLQTVISLNRGGIQATLLGLVDSAGGRFVKRADGYAEACVALPDHFAATPPKFELPAEVERYLNRVGAELRELHDIVEHDPSRVQWERYPHAHDALAAAHDRWVQANLARASDADRLPFDQLDPRTQVRNIPVLLASIVGVLGARDAILDILKNGVIRANGSVSDAGFGLQMHIAASARAALVDENLNAKLQVEAAAISQAKDVAAPAAGTESRAAFERRNRILAQSVADEAAVLALYGAGISDTAVLAKVHAVLVKMGIDAGREYLPGGKGPSAAPKWALAHLGELLQTVHPNMSAADCLAYGKDLLARATIDDVADLMAQSFRRRRVPESGKDLIAKLETTVPKNDYFYAKIGGLPTRGDQKPLNDVELRDLALILRALNVAWKAQTHRIDTKDGSRDWSRGDPTDREAVFNPYDMLIAVGDDHKALFAVIKDLEIGQAELRGK